MATPTPARKRAAKKAAAPAKRAGRAIEPVVQAPTAGPALPDLQSLARDLRSWTGFVLGLANTAADLSFRVAKARLTKPSQRAAVEKAGSVFRDLREAAGLTIADLGSAINLKDVSLLEGVEVGKVGLPFEIILRLAGVLGRNDPIPVALKLTRSYNPQLWKTLESLGIGKLAVQAGREREFANIYRASDRARALSDAEFAAALGFVRASFEAALEFREQVRRVDDADR
ncbi:MAG: helix-turn-helix transcriptional regulator [Proteobacteria bacterium]|nr:helix-turn-helix transcriptional regulator [Pseudomonadota bacterium]